MQKLKSLLRRSFRYFKIQMKKELQSYRDVVLENEKKYQKAIGWYQEFRGLF